MCGATSKSRRDGGGIGHPAAVRSQSPHPSNHQSRGEPASPAPIRAGHERAADTRRDRVPGQPDPRRCSPRVCVPRLAQCYDPLSRPAGAVGAPGVSELDGRAGLPAPESDHLGVARSVPSDEDQLLGADGPAPEGGDRLDGVAVDHERLCALLEAGGQTDLHPGRCAPPLRSRQLLGHGTARGGRLRHQPGLAQRVVPGQPQRFLHGAAGLRTLALPRPAEPDRQPAVRVPSPELLQRGAGPPDQLHEAGAVLADPVGGAPLAGHAPARPGAERCWRRWA